MSDVRPLAVAVCLAGAMAAVSSQERPVFRAGIDLLTLDASVVDGEGRPVTDLGAGDFAAIVDGEARRVVSVRFLEAEAAAARAEAAAAPVPAFTRNQDAGGRIVVFVVDRDSIGAGSERALLEAATTVLDALGAGDAAGAVGLPAEAVELTREHARVRAALVRMTGARPTQPPMWRERQLSWEEALAYERQDKLVIAEVVERECYNIPASETGLTNMCPAQLVDQAREMLLVGRGQVRQTLGALRSLVAQLAPLRGTKQVVLLSGGIPFGFDLAQDYTNFTRQASDAGIVIHAVNIEEFEAGAAVARKVMSSAFGGREHSAGLGAISAGTGGAYYSGVGSAAGVFARLTSELRSFYEVGIETRPDDRPGDAKRVELSVKRPGLSVRSVRRAMLPGGVMPAGADRLALLLQQPTDVPDLPLAAATYTMRGDEESTLRVIIAAEVGDARTRAPAEWGFVIFNEGNPIATLRQKLEGPGSGVLSGAISAKLVPGRYRLRIAAVDADGRPGVADVALPVGLRDGGAVQFSDLMLGVADANGRLQARSTVPQGATLSGLLELMSADAAVLARTRAMIEVAPVGSSEPLKRFLMAARSGAAATILVNQVGINTADLPPGRYVASVIPLLDDQPVGRVSRLFEVIAPAK